MSREIKFEYVGRNVMHGDIVRQALTLEQIQLGRDMLTFFNPDNDNCEMLAKRQYTGIKDKNGKEVYEGDIVRCTTRNKNDKRKIDEKFISEIFWEVDTFLVHDSPKCDSPIGTYDGNNHSLIMPVNPTIEIIGNIYENPEMLEEQNE